MQVFSAPENCDCRYCECGHLHHSHGPDRHHPAGSSCWSTGCRCDQFRADRPIREKIGIWLLIGLLIALVVAFASGCADVGYGYNGPSKGGRAVCLTPEEAFPRYVSHERNDPTATSAGPCETGQTEDTGDEFTICPVRTARHGVIHKRLMTRSCWR